MEERIIVSRPKKRRRNPQLSLLVFVLAFLVIIAAGAYLFFKPKDEEFLLDYSTYAQVGTRDFAETLSVVGSLRPRQVKEIHTLAEGYTQILVAEGQDVVQGDPVGDGVAELVKRRDEAYGRLISRSLNCPAPV